MKYTTKPKTIKINNFSYSFTPSDYRFLNIANNNLISIDEIKNIENVWEQINVIDYLWFNTWYYLWTISWMDSFIYNHIEWSENISPIIYNKSNKKLNKWDIVISRNATLWKASYINSEIKCILNGWLSNIFIENIIKRFYVFWFFINSFLKEQLILKTSAWWTQQNAKRSNLLELKIPFPTKNNNQIPENIELLVSYITQNIINKEEQIKEKNELINNLIEKELKENQKWWKEEIYNFPRLNEIMNEWRIDTKLYSNKYKIIINLIKNYKKWYNRLDKYKIKYRSWSTPFFLETNEKNKPIFIRPTEYSNNRLYKILRYINDNNKTRIDKEEWIIIPRKGTTNFLYKEEWIKVIINDSVKFWTFSWINVKFLFCILSSDYWQKQVNTIKTDVNWWALNSDQIDWLLIPNFSTEKQEEISNLYYFNIENNKDINLNNYLEKEFERNKRIWIFQLNMEIFSLREKLDFFIDKIIKDVEIEIDLSY